MIYNIPVANTINQGLDTAEGFILILGGLAVLIIVCYVLERMGVIHWLGENSPWERLASCLRAWKQRRVYRSRIMWPKK